MIKKDSDERQNSGGAASNPVGRVKKMGASTIDRELIDREIEKTLGCFGRDAAPEPRPDFYFKVRAKIRAADDQAPGVGLWSLFLRRALVPALLAAMIVLNIITAFGVQRTAKTASASVQKQEGLTALASAYGAAGAGGAAGYASYLK